MGLLDSDENIMAQVQANSAYSQSRENSTDLRALQVRLQKMEEYLGLEWSQSNRKYYKVAQQSSEVDNE